MTVAEQEHQETKRETEPVTFISRSPNLKVVIDPKYPRYNDMGRKIGMNSGERAEFDRHRFTTTDPEVADYLRSRPGFNAPSHQGFYEDGAAPDEPKPSIKSQTDAIFAAAQNRDVEAIRAVIEHEDETHKRDQVYAAAQGALAAIAGSQEDAPSTAAP